MYLTGVFDAPVKIHWIHRPFIVDVHRACVLRSLVVALDSRQRLSVVGLHPVGHVLAADHDQAQRGMLCGGAIITRVREPRVELELLRVGVVVVAVGAVLAAA